MALAILSGMDSNSLAIAIFNGDTHLLTKIKRFGQKTAERLVLELKEKVVVDASEVNIPILNSLDVPLTKEMQNAIAILCSLGKSQSEAERLVDAAANWAQLRVKNLSIWLLE